MYSVDIAQLVCVAPEGCGYEQSHTDKLDSHSTIAIDLHDLPSNHVSVPDDNDVWLWSRPGGNSKVLLVQRGSELLKTLLQGCPFTRSGQLRLAVQDSKLFLKALVHPNYLKDGREFSEALNGFFDEQDRFCGLLL